MSQQPRRAASGFLAFVRGSDPKYRERRPAAIIRLLVMVSFYYAVGAALIAYWPAWRTGYHSYFRALGNASFEHFLLWPHASVHFLDLNSRDVIQNIRAKAPPLTLPEKFPVPHRDKVMDTLMLLKNVDPNALGLGQFRTSSRLIGYWPIVTVLALALATPWVWRRKLWLVLWCVLAVHLFVVFRLSISLLQAGFADPKKPFRVVDISPWWFDLLKRFDEVLNDNVTFSFVGGVFVWLAVVIGMELWPLARQKISGKLNSSGTMRQARRHKREPLGSFKPAKRR
jgi:hypothetical protein